MKFNFLENWHLKLLAFIIACIMWFSVVNQQSVQYNINCNIKFSNLSENLIILKDYFDNFNVSITVQGKKNNLLNRKINSINMELDAKKINLKKGKNKIELSPEYFQSYIPDNLQIVDIKPGNLEIIIDEKISKTLKIIPELNGEPQEKYQISNVKVNPEKIKVTGPKTQLFEMTEIKTLPVKINDISNSVITQANLDLNKNFHTETNNVSIEIVLNEKTVEKKIENIKVSFKNPDNLNNYKIIPDSISIIIKGKYSNLNNLNKSKLFAYIELKTGITKFKPIINLPNGIEQISMSPSFVEIKKIK